MWKRMDERTPRALHLKILEKCMMHGVEELCVGRRENNIKPRYGTLL